MDFPVYGKVVVCNDRESEGCGNLMDKMDFSEAFSFDIEQSSIAASSSIQKHKRITTDHGSQSDGERDDHRHTMSSSDEEGKPPATKQLTSSETPKTDPLQRNQYFDKPSNPDMTLMRFEALNLSKPLLKACSELGYSIATPIQAATIPLILGGRDICGSAITGSGKTAAFTLPLLERLLYRPTGVFTTYVLIITPTRELAVQIHSVITDLAKFMDIQVALIVGGFSVQVQMAMLDARPEIVVATPGRLIDHLRNSRSFDLDDVHAVVLDEADQLLKLGFFEEIKEIIRNLPKKRQTLLFSATMTEEVKKLMQLSLNKPVRIAADPSGRIPKKLKQEIIRIRGDDMRKQKEAILCALCSRTLSKGRVIIFCSTKARAHRLKLIFEMLKLPPTGELHSKMSQVARLEALEKFRNDELAYLIATDVAGRGLDIVGVDVVVNYDPPKSLDTYLHRIGRTARAGAHGLAITFINDIHRPLIKEIMTATKQKLTSRILPDEVVAFYVQQLQLHQRHLKMVEQSELEEEKLSQAELEAERAHNIIAHEKEIRSRPPRTWFQTKNRRQEVRRLARLEEDGVLEETQMTGFENPNEKRKKSFKKGEQKEKQRPEIEETKKIKGRVKAIKQMHRLYESQGSASKTAIRRAYQTVLPSKGNNKRKRDEDEEEGFLKSPKFIKRKNSRTKNMHSETKRDAKEYKLRVYSGGAKTRRPQDRTINKRKLNLIKRGGKGKHTFKGKKKFKRR